MNKQEMVDYMITEVEKIERERIAENMSIEPNQKKRDTVARIEKILEGVEISNEV